MMAYDSSVVVFLPASVANQPPPRSVEVTDHPTEGTVQMLHQEISLLVNVNVSLSWRGLVPLGREKVYELPQVRHTHSHWK
jgi:hypothetical protein